MYGHYGVFQSVLYACIGIYLFVSALDNTSNQYHIQ